jgi:hypothetical protein
VENWGIDLHLILREWVEHDNRGRPHMSLGPGFPEPTENLPAQEQPHQHQLPADAKVVAKPILAGLLHEVRLVKRVDPAGALVQRPHRCALPCLYENTRS